MLFFSSPPFPTWLIRTATMYGVRSTTVDLSTTNNINMHLTAGRSTFRLSSCRKLMAGNSPARHPTPFCRASGANWLPMRTQDDVLAALEYLTRPRAVAPPLDPVAQICWYVYYHGRGTWYA